MPEGLKAAVTAEDVQKRDELVKSWKEAQEMVKKMGNLCGLVQFVWSAFIGVIISALVLAII